MSIPTEPAADAAPEVRDCCAPGRAAFLAAGPAQPTDAGVTVTDAD